RLPVALREPVAARARVDVGGNSRARQRAIVGARRACEARQRGAVVCRSRRVRRGAEAPRRRRTAAPRARSQWARIRASVLPVGRRARQVRSAVREGPERALTYLSSNAGASGALTPGASGGDGAGAAGSTPPPCGCPLPFGVRLRRGRISYRLIISF